MRTLTGVSLSRPCRLAFCTGIAVVMSFTLLAPSVEAKAKPKGAAVIGVGTAGTGSFDIDARAGKRSDVATGHIVFHLAIGDVIGTATCVQVRGGLAGVSGTLDAGTTAVDPTQSPGFFLYVQEGSAAAPDLLQLSLAGFIPMAGDCLPQAPVSPAAVTTGDITLFPAKK